MKKIIHLVNKLLLASLLISVSGCQKNAKKEETPVNNDTVITRLEEIAVRLVQKDWAAVSAAFSADAPSRPDEEALKKAYGPIIETGCMALKQTIPLINEEQVEGYTLLSCGDGIQMLSASFDSSLNLSDLCLYEYPSFPAVEETEDYYEEVVYFGAAPKLYGVLTIPKNAVFPSVAVLVPDGLANNRDASGSALTFRKDMAHALAEQGMASFRYDQRYYQNPGMFRSPGAFSPDRVLSQDLASAIHSLEQYPVDASDILLIAHGSGAAYAPELMYHHFELTELVLLEPKETNGIDLLFNERHWPNETRNMVKAQLLQMEVPEEIAGMPTSFWQEWNMLSAGIYTDMIDERVLLLDPQKNSPEWGALLKNTYLTAKNYRRRWLTVNFLNPDREFSKLPAQDIFSWLCGLDISDPEPITRKVKK